MIKIYDIEVFPNFFLYCDIDRDTNEKTIYSLRINDISELDGLIIYLKSIKGQIGFNNINYDAQILQYIINNYITWFEVSSKEILYKIYKFSQEVIRSEFNIISDWEFMIPQLDLFKIWHFDNKAKSCRLKDLQIAIEWNNVLDSSYDFDKNLPNEGIKETIEYCLNDCLSTKRFYELSISQIELRKSLIKETGIKRLINANDPKIGSEIFAKYLSIDMNMNISDLKKLRTYRSKIIVKDILLSFINFQNSKFKEVHEYFKKSIITQTKNTINKSIIIDGIKYKYGTGGIHGFGISGIYESTDDIIIKSCDISSMYPNIAITNNFKPQHLGNSFSKIYKELYEKRKTIPKSNPMNGAIKLMLNGSYGKSNDHYSYFYDPQYTMQITINGQLMLSMLVDMLITEGFKMLMINTDGIECFVPKEKEEFYYSVCKEWETKTNLELEYCNYKKIIARDINNYLAVYDDNKVKYKGDFEINKEYHKDPSFKIVRIALSEYFVNGIDIETTIKNHTKILDFCGRGKFKSDSFGQTRKIGYNNTLNPIEIRIKQQKTTRYYISNKGDIFVKVYPEKKKEEIINKGFLVTIFNQFEEKEDYDINYKFYIDECKKIISIIEPSQQQLF